MPAPRMMPYTPVPHSTNGATWGEASTHRRRGRWLWLLIVAAAIGTELHKPADQRTWHDRLFGVLASDFRPPTLARLKQTVWNPQTERIVVPQAFGIGGSINVADLLHRLGLLRGS